MPVPPWLRHEIAKVFPRESGEVEPFLPGFRPGNHFVELRDAHPIDQHAFGFPLPINNRLSSSAPPCNSMTSKVRIPTNSLDCDRTVPVIFMLRVDAAHAQAGDRLGILPDQ